MIVLESPTFTNQNILLVSSISTPVQVDPENFESIFLCCFNYLFVRSNAFLIHSSEISEYFFIY